MIQSKMPQKCHISATKVQQKCHKNIGENIFFVYKQYVEILHIKNNFQNMGIYSSCGRYVALLLVLKNGKMCQCTYID